LEWSNALTIQISGNYKYEITDDLRLHVWNINADETSDLPFYFQNFNPAGGLWESKEQIESYFHERFPQEEQS
jgi:hypothetical protein